MKRTLLGLLLVLSLGCRIHFTPSQIAALVTTLQSEVATLPGVPRTVIIALDVAQKAITADASGAKWPAIAREALTTVYQDLPAADQDNPAIAGTIAALEVALQFVHA